MINICDHCSDMESKLYLDSLKYMLSNMFAIFTTYMEAKSGSHTLQQSPTRDKRT